MCYDLCGPPIDGTPEDMADYDMWLRDEGPYAPEKEEEDTPATTITEHAALERFDDFLNDCWEMVHICGYDYDPAQALKQCDETAYREEFNNWLNSEGLELE